MSKTINWRDDPIVQIESDVEHVVPLCALWLTDLTTGNGTDLNERYDEWSAAADRAIDRLDDAGKSLFAAMGIETPQDVELLCKSAVATLNELNSRTRVLTDDRPPDGIQAVSDYLRNTVRPALQDALDGLRATFITAIVQRQIAQKSQAGQAIRQVQDISKKIFFISINASVEAARVGDAGKGFSMISQEIRSLSQTAKAAVDDLSSATD